MPESRRKKVVAVSGGFDPLHIGHVRMFEEAKKFGDELVVILNNDNWVKDKKGHVFMPHHERKELIEALAVVDRVVLTDHAPGEYFTDKSVTRALRQLKPDIFANGGDRRPDGDPVPEVVLCKELGIEMVYNVGIGGKVQSSSWLISAVKEPKPSITKESPVGAFKEVTAPVTRTLSPLSPWSKFAVYAFVTFVVLIGALDVLSRLERAVFISHAQTVEAATPVLDNK